MATQTMEDGNLTMLTGIAEKRPPRTWMLWDGADWVRCEDDSSPGDPCLAYLTLAGAIEAVAYFAAEFGRRIRPVLVANKSRSPVAERGVAIPNDDILAPEGIAIPEFYLLWTGAEWVTADDSIGDPVIAYMSDDDATAGYDYHMMIAIPCMPILCRSHEDMAQNDKSRRTSGAGLTDEQCDKIRSMDAAGHTIRAMSAVVGKSVSTVHGFLSRL